MPRKRLFIISIFAAFALFGLVATVAPTFAAGKEKALYSFCSQTNCTDGEFPAGLVSAAAGNLYGSSGGGGAYGYGAVFQLKPPVAGGTWTQTVLYSFCSRGWPCNDGAFPFNGSLIFDAAGNLYGTTSAGGDYQAACGNDACGTVFQLSPGLNGTWTETVLHSFGNGTDGQEVLSGLVSDAAGNLYGTTSFGGASHTASGIVFELKPTRNGTWTETILHSFCSAHGCKDGREPQAGLILDADGNLYGTTTYGGGDPSCRGRGCGVVFELKSRTSGEWTEKVLHAFSSNTHHEGTWPKAGLIVDATGNLYGTTYGGGASGLGTVFELSPVSNGTWTETVLHTFRANNQDGYNPKAGLIFDAAGNLYGTTYGGGPLNSGCSDGCGTVFRLMPGNTGKWTERILHSFHKNGLDGNTPSGLVFDNAGNLYGTTFYGGTGPCESQGIYVGCGTVFEIAP